MKDLLLVTPPFTQLNTPYPATAYLKGFLNTKDIPSFQIDLGIEVILQVFSQKGLQNVFNRNIDLQKFSENSQRIWALRDEYVKTIDQVILFLQGHNPTLARQVCSMNFLPEASRFNTIDDLDFAFGNMGLQDKAKHICTLYLEDISDFIVSFKPIRISNINKFVLIILSPIYYVFSILDFLKDIFSYVFLPL